MQWHRPHLRRTSEDGFTFVEVLVGLLIVSILGTAVATGLSGALRVVDRIQARLLESARLLRLDDGVRDLAERVRVPYFSSGHDATSTEYGLSIAWIDGDPDRTASVEFRDGTIFVSDGGTAQQYPGFAGARATLVEDPDRGVYVLRLDVILADAQEITIIARLGSSPLARGSTG